MHYIYKIENLINHKVYIGQTNNLRLRWNGHCSDANNPNSHSYNLPLYKDIRKYGKDSFKMDVLKELTAPASKKEIVKWEKHYIHKYSSLYNRGEGKGYNIKDSTVSPRQSYEQLLDNTRLLTGEEVSQIQHMLMDGVRNQIILDKFYPRLTYSFLSNINTGYNFYNPNWSYPLKKKQDSRSHFSEEEIQEIKQEIIEGLTYSEIQKRHNIKSAGFISGINSGRYFREKGRTYPLVDKGKYGNRVNNLKWVKGIKSDLQNTDLPFAVIGRKWNKSVKTVSKLNKGLCYKKKGEEYPLRKV